MLTSLSWPRDRCAMVRDLAIAVGSVLVMAVLLGVFKSRGEESIFGQARVIDGDTIVLAHTRVRIFGIDSPELEQPCYYATGVPWPCGREAKQMLTRFIANDPVTCFSSTRDTYQRQVSVCYVRGDDLGYEMVVQGMAVAYRAYSLKYADAEVKAMNQTRGIWGGRFEQPSLWRRQHRK